MQRLLYLLLLCFVAACEPNIPREGLPNVVVAQFDPLVMPPVLPVPMFHSSKPDQPAQASFSDVLDPGTVQGDAPDSPGSIVVFDETAQTVVSPDDYGVFLAKGGQLIDIGPPTGNWVIGHHYLVAIFGGNDIAGVSGLQNEQVVASSATFFMRGTQPLLVTCDDLDNPACDCPYDSQTGHFVDYCISATTVLSNEKAAYFEVGRRHFNALFDQVLAVASGARQRENIVLLWDFTIEPLPTGGAE